MLRLASVACTRRYEYAGMFGFSKFDCLVTHLITNQLVCFMFVNDPNYVVRLLEIGR